MQTNRYIAIDQYGSSVQYRAERPRAGLLKALGAKNAVKIYRDHPVTREAIHVGYCTQGRWFSIARFLEDGELTGSQS